MKPRQLASECDEGPCPTVWAIDKDAEHVLVQGFKVEDEEALSIMKMPEHETAVRIPMALLKRVAREHLT
ncbi:hypothetical protein [Streptomyces formicae]|uniref:Uncharacterized protein n=1 Tax=Streptomyces formicae TaxID=1616117 RepID=A0A291QF12_9ACTN|nr:hypothetical protein [Streptomyces formicae]ATL30025.1 hypothetical protein KY5_5007c [Streptomyces formicae]